MILIATQCFPPATGGIESMMAGLAQALSDRGEAVRVFADGAVDAGDAGQSYQVSRYGGWKPIRRRLKARAIAEAARAGPARAIFCDSWKSLEHLRGDLGNAAVVCLAHGMELPENTDPARAARITAAYAKSTVIVANSAFTAGRVEQVRPEGVPLRIITPPIEAQPPVDASVRAALDARLGDGPLVVTLCRLEPRKGVDRVIAALEWIARRNRHVRLAVAGDGEDRERLEAFAVECGVEHRVTFLGRVSAAEKAALLDRADVFAMPARREGTSVEGFGLVYLEAGFYGTPSVAGREGGAGDAVLNGETGLVVEGDDPMAVAEAIDRLLADARLNLRLGIAARTRALAHLWPQRVRLYMEAARLVAPPVEAA